MIEMLLFVVLVIGVGALLWRFVEATHIPREHRPAPRRDSWAPPNPMPELKERPKPKEKDL